jgi:3-oxoacyl-[acyl-carrier protein] reductase
MLDVNLLGILICGRAVFPYMKDAGGGSIINISSTAAYPLPTPGMPPARNFGNYAYGLAKSGVVFLTKQMARTGGPHNIRVNAIAPGVTMSEATKKVVPPPMIEGLKHGAALGRTLEPWDLTGAATFLASEDSALMTGQTLVVDAGVWMNG